MTSTRIFVRDFYVESCPKARSPCPVSLIFMPTRWHHLSQLARRRVECLWSEQPSPPLSWISVFGRRYRKFRTWNVNRVKEAQPAPENKSLSHSLTQRVKIANFFYVVGSRVSFHAKKSHAIFHLPSAINLGHNKARRMEASKNIISLYKLINYTRRYFLPAFIVSWISPEFSYSRIRQRTKAAVKSGSSAKPGTANNYRGTKINCF